MGLLANKSISIRNKLMMMMMSVTILVLLGSTFMLYQNEVEQIEQAAMQHMLMQAALVSSSVESALVFNDVDVAKTTLALLKINTEVEYAAIILADKRVFADYAKTNSGKITAPTISDFNLTRGAQLQDNYFDVVEPIVLDGEHLGFVVVRASLTKIDQQQQYYQKVIAMVVLACLFLAYILANMFQRVITQPLEIMVSYVKQLSQSKQYEQHMQLGTTDEFSTLADGFNHLLSVVKEREQQLTEHGDNLQRQVDERTKQLYQQAHFDALTQLPNRRLLLLRLQDAISMARRRNNQLAVLFMDIDRFKTINDSLGHNIGDQLLVEFAQRLTEVGRDYDTVARLGGDEFVYLIEDLHSPDSAVAIADKIQTAFAEPIFIGNRALHVSTSIGISVYPQDGLDANALLKNADASMYFAKAKGPGHYSRYEQAMNVSSYQRLELENELRQAIERQQLYLVYQPQHTLKPDKKIKVEALLRWQHKSLGEVPPSVFIPIAEEIGLICELGKWVIVEAFRQIRAWQSATNKRLIVGINISSSHILAVDFVSFIKQQVEQYGISYQQVEFEITEDVFLEHSASTVNILNQLRQLGTQIAIDDFGTGYSSLRYLKNLPVNTLKLDGMFIRDLPNSAGEGIVCSTIVLAHSLNMTIVAECVETQEQLHFLQHHGCDFVQGYYLAKPLSPEQVLTHFNASDVVIG